MLRTRATQAQAQASTSTSTPSSGPGSGSGPQSTPKHLAAGRVHEYSEPDTPTAHYDNRTHVHARNEAGKDTEIDPLDEEGKLSHSHARTTSREMNGQQTGGGLAGRRGEKGMFLDGLSRLQSIGSGGKGKGKAQYRLGKWSSFNPSQELTGVEWMGMRPELMVRQDCHIERGF